MKKAIFMASAILLLVTACKNKTAYEPLFTGESQQAVDNQLIIENLTKEGIQAEHTASGIYYVIENEGEGTNPQPSFVVTCHYSGTLLDGSKFDSSYDRGEPTSFPLRGVIPGWQEAIPLLKKGGKGTFWIPSGMAYGQRSLGDKIPANSVLKFEVELVDFVDQVQVDKEIIQTYCDTSGLNEMNTTDSGIFYKITTEGEGESPTVANTVTCHYEGKFLDGTIFDSSYKRGEPTEFPLSQVIRGWQEAIPLLKPGGKGTFVIPSGIAYGPAGYPPTIPENAVLVFDVELVSFK